MLEPTPLYGGNADFLESLYEQYLRDPASLDANWRAYFERMAPPKAGERPTGPIQAEIVARARSPRAPVAVSAPAPGPSSDNAAKQAAVSRLIQIWTNRGHLLAKVDPLGLTQRLSNLLPAGEIEVQ
jgi:2-oxoglutarate dehydrogenase E1 component